MKTMQRAFRIGGVILGVLNLLAGNFGTAGLCFAAATVNLD